LGQKTRATISGIRWDAAQTALESVDKRLQPAKKRNLGKWLKEIAERGRKKKAGGR